jgi:hypothetical protein
MNRRTFLTALGITPVVAAAKPEPKSLYSGPESAYRVYDEPIFTARVPLIATLDYRFYGDSRATLRLLNTSSERSVDMRGFNSPRSLGGGIALALTDAELSSLAIFLLDDAFNRPANNIPTVAEAINSGIAEMLRQQERPPCGGVIYRVTQSQHRELYSGT